MSSHGGTGMIPVESVRVAMQGIQAAAKVLYGKNLDETEPDDLRKLSDLSKALGAAAPYVLASKVIEAKANNDHITPNRDGYSAGFHYALHCIEGESA